MKLIEGSTPTDSGREGGLLGRARSRLGQTLTGRDSQAHELVIGSMQKLLDNRYVLLHNVTLEGPNVTIPMILVGPPGVRVIYATGLKGVFRAREDAWEELDDRTQRFAPMQPNLLTRTVMMSRAVATFLSSRGFEHPEVEAMVFFSDPGTHVDSTRPVTRVVQADALERYTAGLLQSRVILDADRIQKIVGAFVGEVHAAGVLLNEDDAFSLRDLPEERPIRMVEEVVERHEPQVFKKVPFNTRQLVILGVLILINILLIAGLILLLATRG